MKVIVCGGRGYTDGAAVFAALDEAHKHKPISMVIHGGALIGRKFIFKRIAMLQAKYIEVGANVRYWEDAYVNGVEDTDGALIPCRKGESWEPVINLEDGAIVGWPEGTEADIHFKVCDAGEYWLLDADKNRIAKWNGYYVPNDILCVGDNGYGDYIIFKVAADGKIVGWKHPEIDADQWSPI